MRQTATLVIRPPGAEARFKKWWRWDSAKRRLENVEHGIAYQVVDVVNAETGAVQHEGLIYVTRRVELHVIIRDHDQHVGLVWHHREKMIPPVVSERLFEENPATIPDPLQYATGVTQYECPHGIALQPREEAEQEAGFAIVEAVHIGFVKEDPAMGGVAHKLYATRVSDRPSGKELEEGEQVKGIAFFPPVEVRNVPTVCGFTLAALWTFRSWGLQRHPNTFWHQVAIRL